MNTGVLEFEPRPNGTNLFSELIGEATDRDRAIVRLYCILVEDRAAAGCEGLSFSFKSDDREQIAREACRLANTTSLEYRCKEHAAHKGYEDSVSGWWGPSDR